MTTFRIPPSDESSIAFEIASRLYPRRFDPDWDPTYPLPNKDDVVATGYPPEVETWRAGNERYGYAVEACNFLHLRAEFLERIETRGVAYGLPAGCRFEQVSVWRHPNEEERWLEFEGPTEIVTTIQADLARLFTPGAPWTEEESATARRIMSEHLASTNRMLSGTASFARAIARALLVRSPGDAEAERVLATKP